MDPESEKEFAWASAELARHLSEVGQGDPAVERSGALVTKSMLDWKWRRGDPNLASWKASDLEEYLLQILPFERPRRGGADSRHPGMRRRPPPDARQPRCPGRGSPPGSPGPRSRSWPRTSSRRLPTLATGAQPRQWRWTYARQMPVLPLARMAREHDTRIWRVIEHHVGAARAPPGPLGRHRPRRATRPRPGEVRTTSRSSWISEERRVIFATPGRDAAVVGAFADDLAAHHGAAQDPGRRCAVT